MSIGTVVTMGFGSFGSVNLLPTIGYSQGAAAVPDSLCICDLTFTVNSLSVSFSPINDLDIEFTPPCDC